MRFGGDRLAMIVRTGTAGLLVLGCGTSCQSSQNNPAMDPVAREIAAVKAPESNRDLNWLSYSGHWEYVHDRGDGRFLGRSARSFHAGDTVTLLYDGEGFRLYGVSGPNGGIGTVVLPGQPAAQISFYSRERRTHVLLYTSPRTSPGLHSAGMVVTRPADGKRGYVNVDEIQVYGQRALLSLTHREGY